MPPSLGGSTEMPPDGEPAPAFAGGVPEPALAASLPFAAAPAPLVPEPFAPVSPVAPPAEGFDAFEDVGGVAVELCEGGDVVVRVP